MATYEVPGYNPANQDRLAAGCWAERPNGDKLLIEDMRDQLVAFVILGPKYRAARMAPVLEFQRDYSNGEWLWHDKTPFPALPAA